MNPCRCVPHLAAMAVLLPLSVTAPSAAVPIADDLAHCAAITRSDARLACYDALAVHSADRPVSTPATPITGAMSAPGAPASVAAALAPTAGSTASTAAAVVAAPAPNDPQTFGLAQIRVNEPPKGPAAIQAHIAQLIDNGITRASVVLDNGQTWTFAESSEDAQLRPGDPVTVRRAALGSFMLVTPSKHSYHVHRIR